MKLFSFVLMSLLLSPADFFVATELEPGEMQKPIQIETIYDSKKDQTSVRLKPVQISGEQAQYHSAHLAPAFSYPGQDFRKPESHEVPAGDKVNSRGQRPRTDAREIF